jgi:hypothetical protein
VVKRDEALLLPPSRVSRTLESDAACYSNQPLLQSAASQVTRVPAASVRAAADPATAAAAGTGGARLHSAAAPPPSSVHAHALFLSLLTALRTSRLRLVLATIAL